MKSELNPKFFSINKKKRRQKRNNDIIYRRYISKRRKQNKKNICIQRIIMFTQQIHEKFRN